jgi:Fur family iron response transcriptional regulator
LGASAQLRAQVEEKLREHGVKATPQRIEIGALLLAKPCHMSADQLLSSLKAQGSRVSKATVYNTLHLFSQQGIVREVALDPSRLVYDSTTSFHHHFYNVDTGELTDIDTEGLAITGLPELPPGTLTESVELIIRVRSKA